MKFQTWVVKGALRLLGNATPRGIALLASAFSMGALAVAASSAHGATVTYEFVDGVSPFDSKNANGSVFETKDGITLTSVSSKAPQYVNPSGTIWTWDGTSYNPTNPQTAIGTNGLGIDNRSYNFFSESGGFNPDESWTMKFNVPVIFRGLNFNSIDPIDLMRVLIETTPTPTIFDFVDSDFNSSDDKTDPFGALVIPANTNITFLNSSPSVMSMDSAGASSQQPQWRWTSLTVESVELQVPEPSAFLMASIAVAGLGTAIGRRWRRSTR